MKKKWYLKGSTGEMLQYIKESHRILYVTQGTGHANSAVRISTPEGTLIKLTIRGSSKCRRKQARELRRWLTDMKSNATEH